VTVASKTNANMLVNTLTSVALILSKFKYFNLGPNRSCYTYIVVVLIFYLIYVD